MGWDGMGWGWDGMGMGWGWDGMDGWMDVVKSGRSSHKLNQNGSKFGMAC